MYADDSSTFIAQADKTRKAREIIKRYERETAGQLHNGKAIVVKLGKTRQRDMTSKQLGVSLE